MRDPRLVLMLPYWVFSSAFLHHCMLDVVYGFLFIPPFNRSCHDFDVGVLSGTM